MNIDNMKMEQYGCIGVNTDTEYINLNGAILEVIYTNTYI